MTSNMPAIAEIGSRMTPDMLERKILQSSYADDVTQWEIKKKEPEIPEMDAPMWWLPIGEKREIKHSRNTSRHELKHALRAHQDGNFDSLSVIPEGDSLGRTFFKGFISTEKFHEYAAASAVGDEDYTPSGTVMDQHMVESSGGSWRQSISNARSSLSGIPFRQMQIATDIVAHMGTVSSARELSLILDQAKFEMMLERGEAKLRVNKNNPEIRSKDIDTKYEKPEEYTRYDNLGDGNYRMTYVNTRTNERKQIDFRICPDCHQMNSHSEACRHNGSKDNALTGKNKIKDKSKTGSNANNSLTSIHSVESDKKRKSILYDGSGNDRNNEIDVKLKEPLGSNILEHTTEVYDGEVVISESIIYDIISPETERQIVMPNNNTTNQF